MCIRLFHIITFLLFICVLTFTSCGGGGSGNRDEGGVECVDGSGIMSSHWAKTYDVVISSSIHDSTEFDGYIQQADDGGYMLAGSVYAVGFSDKDILLIRMDSYGNPIWAKVFNRAGYDDSVISIQKIEDNGYIVTVEGLSTGSEYSRNYLVIKLDPDGNPIWQKVYSDGRSIEQTSDGGYIVGGDRCIFKLDSTGNILWSKSYNGVGGLAKQIEDSGYIVVRGNPGIGGSPVDDIESLKIDENGEVVWFKDYDMGGENRYLKFLHGTLDNGYIFGGHGSHLIDGYNIGGAFLMKLDSGGNVNWGRFFVSVSFKDMEPIGDEEFVVIGNSSAFNEGFDKDIWVIKLNQNGDVIWQKTYGGDYSEHGNSVIETEDGDYIVSGVTMSFGQEDGDIWVLKIRPDGIISADAPAGFGVDTDADIVDLGDFMVYEWPLEAEDCTVSVSDVTLMVTDVGINVCAQAWD
jgi:hypothetical protein